MHLKFGTSLFRPASRSHLIRSTANGDAPHRARFLERLARAPHTTNERSTPGAPDASRCNRISCASAGTHRHDPLETLGASRGNPGETTPQSPGYRPDREEGIQDRKDRFREYSWRLCYGQPLYTCLWKSSVSSDSRLRRSLSKRKGVPHVSVPLPESGSAGLCGSHLRSVGPRGTDPIHRPEDGPFTLRAYRRTLPGRTTHDFAGG